MNQQILDQRFTKESILRLIKEQLPHIPTARLVSLDDLVQGNRYIVRSDSLFEWDAFQGMFTSKICRSPNKVREVLEKGEKLDVVQAIFDRYCKVRSLDPKEVLDSVKFFIQEYKKAKAECIIMEHPNIDDYYFIKVFGSNYGDIFICIDYTNETTNKITCWYKGEGNVECEIRKKDLGQILENIVLCRQIKHSLQLDQSYVYEFETSMYPTFVHQVRRFRKREYADFKVDISGVNYLSRFVIGITPEQGWNLPVFDSGDPRMTELFMNCDLGLDNEEELKKKMSESLKERLKANKRFPDGWIHPSRRAGLITTYFPNVKAIWTFELDSTIGHSGREILSTVPVISHTDYSIIGRSLYDLADKNAFVNIKSDGRTATMKLLN